LGFWGLDFGGFDFGFWILDFGVWSLDFGFLVFGVWILESGVLNLGFWIWVRWSVAVVAVVVVVGLGTHPFYH